jgi:peroxiredoxin
MGFNRRVQMDWPLVAVVALTLLLAGCAGGDSEEPAGDAESMNLIGPASKVAPDFELPDLSGEAVSLAATAGSVRLIDFWATWCPPCRDEIPMLNELHQTYGGEGLTILAISDEKAEVVREFAEEVGMNYTNLIDPGDVSASYRVLGLPTAFLIDRDGRIVDSYMGPKSRKHLEEKIRELLAQPAANEG